MPSPGSTAQARGEYARRQSPAGFVLICGIGLACVILSLTATVILQNRSRDIDNAYARLRSMDTLLAEQTAGALKSIDLVLDRLADEIQASWVQTGPALAGEMAGLEKHLALASKIAGVPQLDVISVVDAQGNLLNFSRYYPVPPINVADRDYFRALRDAPAGSQSFISQPVVNRGTGTRTVYVARRLSAPDGSFLGLVLGGIQTEYFRALYDGVRDTGDLAISLWRDDGSILVRAPPPLDTPEAQHIPPALLPLIRRGASSLFRTPHGTGRPLLVATTIPVDYPIIVSVTQPEKVALAEWRRESVAMGAAGVGCALLVVLLTMTVVRQVGAYGRLSHALLARDEAERGREQAEEQLRQAQKMEAIGQLTAGLAHDLNNTLLSVVGGAEQLECQLGPGHRSLELIRQASERATAVTRQLLAFSRQSLLQPRPLALAQVLSAMRPLLDSSLGPGIALVLRVPENLWPVFADATQVEQMVLNLVLNARDAMPQGGRLMIEGRNLRQSDAAVQRPTDLPAGDHVLILVSDEGGGMPPEVAARAFDPFFTTKPQGKGTGLGLSQVYGVARQSGGGVVLASTPGQGTIVTVFLPRSSAAPSRGGGAADTAPPLPRGHVLVVDDDAMVRETVLGALAMLGCRTDVASDGAMALRLLQDGLRPDAVLLDFAMPGLNGAETASRIRATHPGLPIVFMTGHADPAPLSEERWLLIKPFRATQLARVMAEAMRQNATAAE